MNIFDVHKIPHPGIDPKKPEHEAEKLVVNLPQFGQLTKAGAINLAVNLLVAVDANIGDIQTELEAIRSNL